ncbi:MAG: polymer-forming cytoskeletal protein [Prevotellaceae bacterium]|jgi:cytoskeletal protein CcmA (bactofilin family)|nr:polymer-forming cytoskeletal protein [Prevotellaceae bacterium]
MAKEITPNTGLAHNVLAGGSLLKGNIVSDSDFRVDGTVEGKIQCSGRVVIGPKGEIIGDIECNNADIMGNLKGNIVVTDTLSLKSTANVRGDIKTKVLIIEPEAVFCGTCDMGNSEKAALSEFIVSEEKNKED